MKKWKIFLTAAALILSSLACLFGSSEPQATPDISAMTTSVAATLRAQNDQAPTRTPEEEIVETPACLPLHPGRQELDLPIGFTAGVDISAISFYDTEGNLVGEKQTPGLTRVNPNQVHIAGGVSNGISGVPLVYASSESQGVIKGNIDSNIFQIDSSGEVVALSGAEGIFTLISYSAAEGTDEGYLTTIKTGEMEDLAATTPQLTRLEDDVLVYNPLAVHAVEGQNQGTWFTFLKYGMSDFSFMPYNGLFYFDFSLNQVTEYLSTDYRIKGFSPDQSLVAFGNAPDSDPDADLSYYVVRDLVNCQEWIFPWHESSIRGGGRVAFSPDNQSVAWIEAGGLTIDDTVQRLRISKLDQNQTTLVDSELENLTGLAGGEIPSYLAQVSWISNHVLLLQIGVPGVETYLLVAFAPDPDFPLDPVLGANQAIPLAEGSFTGFLYP
jgi:hypothetical protein